jgi:exosortase/archaeosortase
MMRSLLLAFRPVSTVVFVAAVALLVTVTGLLASSFNYRVVIRAGGSGAELLHGTVFTRSGLVDWHGSPFSVDMRYPASIDEGGSAFKTTGEDEEDGKRAWDVFPVNWFYSEHDSYHTISGVVPFVATSAAVLLCGVALWLVQRRSLSKPQILACVSAAYIIIGVGVISSKAMEMSQDNRTGGDTLTLVVRVLVASVNQATVIHLAVWLLSFAGLVMGLRAMSGRPLSLRVRRVVFGLWAGAMLLHVLLALLGILVMSTLLGPVVGVYGPILRQIILVHALLGVVPVLGLMYGGSFHTDAGGAVGQTRLDAVGS